MGSNGGAISKHVVVFGLNHTTSTTAVRDRLLFSEGAIPAALASLRATTGILEAVILSTCNRVEIYVVTTEPDNAAATLTAFCAGIHGIAPEEFATHTYCYRCAEAVNHLFNVIASLDSVVVGETQILSQVKAAFKLARESGATGTVLNKLFQFAVTAGKRVRTETKIGEGAVSISQAGVELAKKILGRLSNHCALIIGAGEMSELTARHLKAAGIGKLFFANRTLEHAAALSKEFNGIPLGLSEMAGVMPDCDIVISSTASPGYVIGPDEVREALARRKGQPMLFIDIAAPRDIHPDVGRLYNAFLYTIDDLAQAATFNLEMRGKEIGEAFAILENEKQKYFEWYNYLRVQPVMLSLRNRFEQVRQRKLQQCSSELSSLPPQAQQFVHELINGLTAEYLEEPSRVLRESSNTDDWPQFSESIIKIFNLKPTL